MPERAHSAACLGGGGDRGTRLHEPHVRAPGRAGGPRCAGGPRAAPAARRRGLLRVPRSLRRGAQRRRLRSGPRRRRVRPRGHGRARRPAPGAPPRRRGVRCRRGARRARGAGEGGGCPRRGERRRGRGPLHREFRNECSWWIASGVREQVQSEIGNWGHRWCACGCRRSNKDSSQISPVSLVVRRCTICNGRVSFCRGCLCRCLGL